MQDSDLLQPGRKAAYLEWEEGLEVVVDLPGVGAASPVAWQVVGVCHHLQQSQLGVKGCPPLLDEGPAQGQNDPQHRCPPAPDCNQSDKVPQT